MKKLHKITAVILSLTIIMACLIVPALAVSGNIPADVVAMSSQVAVDIEQEAIDLYEYNFPNIKNYGDITKIEETKLPDFDLFTGGFPCQPFSTVGKMLGELDTRGTLFNDIIRISNWRM